MVNSDCDRQLPVRPDWFAGLIFKPIETKYHNLNSADTSLQFAYTTEWYPEIVLKDYRADIDFFFQGQIGVIRDECDNLTTL